jgi:ribosomal protein S18 acetylase RimI-like enzyme
MLTIRPMLESDANAVRQVDRLAFLPLLKKNNPGGPYPIRKRENVLAARAIFPLGCFVAEDEASPAEARPLAGYIFSRVWGEVGWVGVFGVHPERQGGQVGKQLLTEAVGALESAGCATIGLETMPDSTYNIGLYARRGFRPITMTVTLEKAIAPHQIDTLAPGVTLVTGLDDERGLRQVTAISRAAWPELDLRAEAENALAFGWGDVLLLGEEGHPWLAAVMRVAHRRESEAGAPLPNPTGEIAELASLPQGRDQLAAGMRLLEGYAAAMGFERLRVAFNSADWPSLRALLDAGYRVAHASLRFIYKGDYSQQPGLEFSRWAM